MRRNLDVLVRINAGAALDCVDPSYTSIYLGKITRLLSGGVAITVKGALIGGELMNADQIEALSKLPTKLELIASLMGTMKAPVQKLAATLLAYVESKGGAAEAASEN